MIQETAAAVTYGWGMIPVTVTIGEHPWTTSLWPKDGRYVVPLKDKVRKAERLAIGDVVAGPARDRDPRDARAAVRRQPAGGVRPFGTIWVGLMSVCTT